MSEQEPCCICDCAPCKCNYRRVAPSAGVSPNPKEDDNIARSIDAMADALEDVDPDVITRDNEQMLAAASAGVSPDLKLALEAIYQATRGDEKGEHWTLRKFLDARGVFNDDVSSTRRLVSEVCRLALEPRPVKCRWCNDTGRRWDNGDKTDCECKVERKAPAPSPAPSAGVSPDLKVTRLEVIGDKGGRLLVLRPTSIELSYQDNSRTLKIFATEQGEAPSPPPASGVSRAFSIAEIEDVTNHLAAGAFKDRVVAALLAADREPPTQE